MSRLADPLPVACSVCLQPPMVRNHELRYVDFEVAHEGPVVTRHGEDVSPEQTVRMPVDDLVICEECLKRAAELIGMSTDEEVLGQMARLKETINELKADQSAKDALIGDLENTVRTLIDHPIKRRAGAPKLVGPDDRKDEIKKVRKRRATAKRISEGKQKEKA